MSRLASITALGYLFVLGSTAQSDICKNVKGYYNYAAHGEFDFTGFYSGTDHIGPCECGPWKYSQNVIGRGSNATQSYYLDTQGALSGSETNNRTGICTEGLRVFDKNQYFFSKEVLQRSLNDEGDCKVMLGAQCADALKLHFLRESIKYIRAGGCPGSADVAQNNTVPWECAGLVGNSKEWFADQLFSLATNPADSLDKVNTDNSCPAITDPNEHSGEYAHLLGSHIASLNQAVRFPTPTFFTFFPNTEEARSELAANASRFDLVGNDPWSSPNWVQISCITSWVTVDIDPPSAEELLKDIPDGAEAPISVKPSDTPITTPSATGPVTATISGGIYPTGGYPYGGGNSTYGNGSASGSCGHKQPYATVVE